VDLLGVMSQVADASQPRIRDRLPTAAFVLVTSAVMASGVRGDLAPSELVREVSQLSLSGGVVTVLDLFAATILLDPY
jgi:hypothetical protein